MPVVVGGACSSSRAMKDRSRRNGRERASNVRETGRGMSGLDRSLTRCFTLRSDEGVVDLSGSLACSAGERKAIASKRRLENRLIKSWSLDNKSSEGGRSWTASVPLKSAKAVCSNARNATIDLCVMISGSSGISGMVDLVDFFEVNPRP